MPHEANPSLEERLERAEQQLRALREIGLALESTMTFEEVLTLAVERTTRLLGAERSTLFLLESDGSLLSRVIEGEGVAEIRLASGQGIAGWVARHSVPQIVHKPGEDERFDRSWDAQTGFTTRDLICHPILGRHGTVIGVAEVLNRKDGSFTSQDLELLGMLCGQLAMTVENSRMMVDLVEKNRTITESKLGLERRNRELNLLLEMERLVARAEDMDSLSVAVLGRILVICGAEVGILHKIDETGSESRIHTLDGRMSRVIRVAAGEGFSGWVAAKGKPILIDAPSADPRFRRSIEQRVGIPLRNLVAVPLPFAEESQNRGSLLVANKQAEGGFGEQDMMLLKLVANQLAQAMDHLLDREQRERERRLATVGRLLAGVLHDLKSPITVVSGYAEMLASMVGTPEGEDYLSHVNRALERITRMAEEIVAFSRGERELLAHTVLIDEFMESFAGQVRRHLESNGIALKMHLRTAGTIVIDGDKMFRAFQNIVMNAMEAMPDGGEVIVEVDRLGDDVVFGFTDTGSGIPEEIQGNLFNSFVTLGKEQGTGLGLAVAREIVEGHGGRISFTTSRGGGTTFIVCIPVRPVEACQG